MCPSFGIPATCYRTENAQTPKSAGESAGKKGTAGSSAVSLLFQRDRPPSTAPSSPPSSPLFPGTLPSTLPDTFGGLGVLSPVAGRWDSNPSFGTKHATSADSALLRGLSVLECSVLKIGNRPNIRFRRVRFQTPSSVRFLALDHRVPGRELSEFLSAYSLCAKASSPSFRRIHWVYPKTQWGSVSSLLRNSTLETVFRLFPIKRLRLRSVYVSVLDSRTAKLRIWTLRIGGSFFIHSWCFLLTVELLACSPLRCCLDTFPL